MTLRVGFVYNFSDTEWMGGKNYFANLFRAVHDAVGSAIDITIITGCKHRTTVHEELPFVELIQTPLLDRGTVLWALRQVIKRFTGTDILLRAFVRRNRIQLLSHSFSLGENSGVKTIGWLYDFQFMKFPEHWSPKNLLRLKAGFAASCRQCDALILSSHAALSDLHGFMPQMKATRHVLQFVSSPVNFESLTRLSEIRSKYEIPEQYFYLPNQFWQHKNHDVVIEALAELKACGTNATVVCTGSPHDERNPLHFQMLTTRINALGLTAQFKILGLVPYKDSQSLMANCVAVINPSRFEGWSTTVEEAKTFDKRLILSNLPVHQEQCPQGLFFFDPSDATTLATHMRKCLDEKYISKTDADRQSDLEERTKLFAAKYIAIVHSVMRQE
jgi:glycosyltransferase involved in cell wall biosynthesis